MIKPTLIALLIISILACASKEDSEVISANSKTGLEKDSLTYLALGDSYTIGQSVNENERWPIQLTNELNSLDSNLTLKLPQIIAKTGWTTQELGSTLDKESLDADYDFVSLLIGVNNQYRGYPISEYPMEFSKLLDRAIYYAGGNIKHVIVLSIPDYGYTPFGQNNQQNIFREIDAYNNINKEISLSKGVLYYDITPISRNGFEAPDLVASDGLHPSGKQYGLWVEKILSDTTFISVFKN